MTTRVARIDTRWSLVCALVASACTSDTSSETPPPAGPVDWVGTVARDPASFASLMERTNRDGWIAFHGNDLRAAETAFEGSDPTMKRSRARVEWSLALLYDDLARASDYTHMAFLSSWAARELPTTPGIETVAATWRGCGGMSDVPDADKLPDIFRAEPTVEAPGRRDRHAVHERARAGEVEALYAVAGVPLVVEPADGFERKFYDPCVYHTLHDAWEGRAQATASASDWRGVARQWGSEAGLEGLLFAPWLTVGDLEAGIANEVHPGTLGASQPSLVQFGVGTDMSVQDDVEVARDDVRALDAAIDLRERSLIAEAGDEGDALLRDLGLHARFRQEWIVARARKAILEGRPHQAMAYLELARDVSVRQVGPSNSPSVLALYAETQVRLGRTREALDVLVLLEQTHPEVLAFRELVGDLAVLQGLDRQGDSKEN